MGRQSSFFSAMRSAVNNHELRVVGMSRSGNHAILQWIVAQAQGRICFLNCAEPKANPFLSARPLESERVYEANYPGFRLRQEQQGKLSAKDYLIVSYEDVFLRMLCRSVPESEHEQWVGRSRQRYDVLILRDPFNLFASRLKFGASDVTPKTAVRIWKQHAREVLGECRHLTQQAVFILYNRWFRNRQYRRRVAEQLGLKFTDAGFQRVPRTGGGSSFDGLRRQGQASRMKVMDRWKHFIDDPHYLELFDEEVLRLARAIFGGLSAADKVEKRLDSQRKTSKKKAKARADSMA